MKADTSGKTLESMSQAIWYNQWTMKKFSNFFKGEILEVGCGIGNFTETLTSYGKVWAIDINNKYLSETKKSVGSEIKVGFGNIETGKYFFKDKKFDTIVCLNVLEHIKKDQLALRNLYKLLEDSGHLILLVPAHQFLYGSIDESIGHFRRYEKESLKKILGKIGFEIINIRLLNFLGAMGWFAFGRLIKNKKVEEKNIKIFNLVAPLILPFENFIEPPIGTSILAIVKK